MPVADALRSQLAWSSKNESKSLNTASSHSGGVFTRKSSIGEARLYPALANLLLSPAVAGYSGTPLPQKLGIKPGFRVAFVAAPPAFAKTLGKLPEGAKSEPLGRSKATFDVVIAFFEAEAEFKRELPRLERAIPPAGAIWIAWPKRASGVPTDMTEDVVRKHARPRGLVDNKVCAIDDTWSGLRLVVRLENRPKR
jgi:hypothetical protein